MSLSNHVSLTITTDSVGVARAGFGVPLILSANAAWAERIRFYTDIVGVSADFAATSPEVLAATAEFSQSPHPERIAIGRSALPPTQVYELTPDVTDDYTYEITVVGEGVTTETVSFTSDSTAILSEITLGLTTALNGVVGKNYTAVDNTTSITVTATAAGDWFSLELGNPGLDGVIEQDHVDPGIATDLAAIQDEDDSWYCLITLYNSNAYVLAAAAWTNARKKIYVPDTNDSNAIRVAVGAATDTLDDLKTLNYGRVAGVYHPSPAAFNAAAWSGRCLPTEVGSITWKYKTLQGVPAVVLTSTHRTNLVAKSANFNQTVAGKNIMAEGTTSDGDYVDVQRGIDWLDDDMSKAVFTVLSAADKVPYTDPGASVVQAEVLASLQRAVDRQILALDPAPVVTVPAVADVATADKTARNLPDVKFSGTLAGAIHKATISGVVSV